MPTTPTVTDADRYRLPRTARPRRYEIEIRPDLEAASFTGRVAIEIDVLEPTATLVVNAAELDIARVHLTSAAGAQIDATAVSADEETERLTIELAGIAEAGAWVLHAEFTGVLNDKLVGFYRSTFTDTDGVEQTIATTQFEATHARKAFPCWDEPEYKAAFAVTLVVDEGLTAISNAAEISRTPADDGRVAVRFADTMVMSTYLVAFVVGPFEVTDPVDVRGTPLRVVCPRGKAHLTSFALEVGAFCLEYFADYYEIPYPGDKCDLVAVPDFAFGAMENLGCITFREVLLLVDPSAVTQPELQNVTDVIAHELAHMWFGDLVTMKWWNGIWLNEAFATFMEMKATDAFRPDWDRWTTFGLSRSAAMDTDALHSTRAIEYEVVSPDDAEGMFDVLTYEKGAAVVRMLEQFLGEDLFREGIRRYLTLHAYGNTETTDLWDALESVTGEPVRWIMDTWIFQPGMPVVDVDLVDDAGTLRLTQERFTYLPAPEEAEPIQWAVPVIFSQSHEGVVTFEKELLDEPGLDVAEFETVDWVLGNTEGIGFYRTAHAPTLTAALVAHVDGLSAIERYGLVDDLWALTLADRVAASTVIDLLDGFAGERDLSVWQRIIGVLQSVDHILDGDDARAGFRARVGRLLAPAVADLGPDAREGDTDRDRQLRGVLFDAAGTLADDAAVEARARDLHRAAVAGATVDPALLAAAIRVIAATGGHGDFDELLERFRSASTPQEEIRYLYALGELDDDALVDRVHAMVLAGEIRTQNAPYLVRGMLGHRVQGPRSWDFVRAQWDHLSATFPSNSIVRMLEGIRSLSAPTVADSVFAFFTDHEVPQGDKQLAQHLERLEVNVALRRREAERLAHHLR